MYGFEVGHEPACPPVDKDLVRRIRVGIGKEKAELKDLALQYVNGNSHALDGADERLRYIKYLKAWVNELEETTDPVDEFYRYLAPWDNGNGNAPEEFEAFHCIGEPSPELLAHEKQKQRHAKRRWQKLHR